MKQIQSGCRRRPFVQKTDSLKRVTTKFLYCVFVWFPSLAVNIHWNTKLNPAIIVLPSDNPAVLRLQEIRIQTWRVTHAKVNRFKSALELTVQP